MAKSSPFEAFIPSNPCDRPFKMTSLHLVGYGKIPKSSLFKADSRLRLRTVVRIPRLFVFTNSVATSGKSLAETDYVCPLGSYLRS
jgi:hypothetical protein